MATKIDRSGREVAYTPPEVAGHTLDEIRRRQSDKAGGVPLGLSHIDRDFLPLRPGELCTVIARPSQYKTGLAQWWARRLALECLEQERSDVVVFATAEMAIEELGIYDLAIATGIDAGRIARGQLDEGDWNALDAASMKRAATPLWLLGHSLANRKRRIRLSIRTIERALFWIEDNMQFTARILFLDYLNLLDSDRSGGHEPSRRLDLSETVQSAKDLALSLGCPVVMIAQAHRQVDERAWKLPEMRDCMETAAIEQYSDRMLSLWYPARTEAKDWIQTPGGARVDVTDHFLLLGIVKQKQGVAGRWYQVFVDPAKNELAPMAREQAEDAPSNARRPVQTTTRKRWVTEEPGVERLPF